MALGTIQSAFISGEIDPQARSRVDLIQYYNGCERLRNMMVKPQGGAFRRPGLEYIDTLLGTLTRITGQTITTPNGGTGANANDDDITTLLTTTTGISTTNPYVVIHYDLGTAVAVKFADVVGLYSDHSADVTGEFVIQYSDNDADWTTLGAAIDCNNEQLRKRSRRRLNGTGAHRYWRFARVGSTDMSTAIVNIEEFNLWTEDAALSGYREVPFQFSITQKYVLLFTDRNCRVYKDKVYQADVRSPYDSAELATIEWAQSLDTALMTHEDVYPQRLVRQGSDTDWMFSRIPFIYIPKYNFTPTETNPATTLTPSATDGTVTLTAGASTFTAADVDQYVSGNGGRARIIKYTSGTVVTAVVELPFFDTTAIPSGEWTIEGGYEDAWSSTRGYPAAVTLIDQRLALGGGSRPSTYWLSRAGVLFDFNLGSNLEDDGIEVTIATEKDTPIIYHLVNNDDLQIFTSSGEYIHRKTEAGVITPAASAPKQQSSNGTKPEVRPVKVHGATLFIQRKGKGLREFLYDDIRTRYTATNISILASHLLNTPLSMAHRAATEADEGNLVYVVNTDGTLAVLTTLRDQEITAWTLQTTDGATGLFKDVTVDLDDVYVVTERTINGGQVRYLEMFNPTLRVDAGVYQEVATATSSLAGLDHLEGETVSVILDGALQEDLTVSGGSVTFARDANSTIEIGLPYTWQLKPMPIAEALADGTKVGKLKRTIEVTLELYATQDFLVNGVRLPSRRFSGAGASSPLNTFVQPFTGRKIADGLQGFTLEGQPDITGPLPLDATILGLEMKVVI